MRVRIERPIASSMGLSTYRIKVLAPGQHNFASSLGHLTLARQSMLQVRHVFQNNAACFVLIDKDAFVGI